MAYKMGLRVLQDAESYSIREAAPDEVENLLKMFKKDMSAKWVDQHHNLPGKKVALVVIDKETNQPIGGIERVVDTENGIATGVGFAVLKDFRRRGIGTTMLKVMDEELKNMGVTCITTVPASKNAAKFLKENGYEYEEFIKMYLAATFRSDKLVYGFEWAGMKKYL
ncbi:GNAT family N-acetyltransferase [Candidatus Micrarchaeota archaeon]|nr:GNAT family N-acetyltransferase [Candidatus Micrarchaeota archaeon]